jgi:hypothetical protein
MKFDDLNKLIPLAKGGKEKILKMQPYPNITLAMPGRHAEETNGADYCVMVTDPVFKIPEHQFTHTDIFKDIEAKKNQGEGMGIVDEYFKIIQGADPLECIEYSWHIGTMATPTLYAAAQCLAVAEHRRYAQYENKFGGRYLPFRFAAGIAEGLWTAADASNWQRKGRPGVEILEKQHGTPTLTKELMS